jgi:hypothetical protein
MVFDPAVAIIISVAPSISLYFIMLLFPPPDPAGIENCHKIVPSRSSKVTVLRELYLENAYKKL